MRLWRLRLKSYRLQSKSKYRWSVCCPVAEYYFLLRQLKPLSQAQVVRKDLSTQLGRHGYFFQ